MKSILGVKGWDLSEYAISANAILGIRDSGKTYTATEAAEELYEAGVPFIAFDPIGVWHSLRIPGRGKGYPVVVAGGKHADLPLTRKNAGAIVRAAMGAEVSLVLDLFSIELSKSDWRAIVRECVEILLHENSEHGLRHVFIEEAAEFVPQRVQDGHVFAAVEKLVRMGGNSKLGCTLINQRSADLNKSVLELCANVFVHRQTGKNTLLDLKKWMEVMSLSKDEQVTIGESLPDLKSGECWAFINDLKKPVRLKVPAKNSQHPDRRAVVAKGQEKRKPVPADAFVAQMTAKLAEKDKPAPKPAASQPVAKINMPDQRATDRALEASHSAGYAAGFSAGWAQGWTTGHRKGCEAQVREFDAVALAFTPEAPPPAKAPKVPHAAPVPRQSAPAVTRAQAPAGATISPTSRKILAAVHAAFPAGLSYSAAAARVGVSNKSSAYGKYRTEAFGSGEVEVGGDRMRSLPGFAAPMEVVGNPVDAWARRLPPSYGRMLQAVAAGYSAKDDIAAEASVSPTSSGLSAGLKELLSLELISLDGDRYSLHENLRV